MVGTRRILAGIVPAAVLVALGMLAGGSGVLAGTPTDARVSVGPGCEGAGHAGEATDDAGRRVTFRVCSLPGGGFDAEIRDRAGRPLSRIVHGPEGRFLLEVGGVAVEDGEHGEDEAARIARALDSADGPLAGRLPLLLVEAGWQEDDPLVRALGAHGPAWEDRAAPSPGGLGPRGWGCTDPATGCRGCCGPGCWGCTGICTPECLAHDECVEEHGHRDRRCLRLLVVAIQSYLECLDCPAKCRMGPADCCDGEGPACVGLP